MNVYEAITKEIIEAIQQGVNDHIMPWHNNSSLPTNPVSGTVYSGVNILSLWSMSLKRSFPSNNWATYKQWQDIGVQVDKGQHGTPILFYQKKEEEEGKPSFIAKSYMVFNQYQTRGYQEELLSDEVPLLSDIETFLSKTGANILRNSPEASYIPSLDIIRMPPAESFFCGETRTAIDSYYSVLFHELTHWTGHLSRLDRDLKGRFGSESYALEELIAELGSAFLCAHLKLNSKPRLDHAPYINTWLKVLKSDHKAIFVASSMAKVAVEFVMKKGEV